MRRGGFQTRPYSVRYNAIEEIYQWEIGNGDYDDHAAAK